MWGLIKLKAAHFGPIIAKRDMGIRKVRNGFSNGF